MRWEQPVERACYRLQRAAQYCFPGRLGDERRLAVKAGFVAIIRSKMAY